MVLFQLTPVALYGLLPVRVVFHELVMRLLPEYCQLAVQPDFALVPVLLTRIAPVKPEPQELLTTYEQLTPPVVAALLDERLDAGVELAGVELGATLLLDAGVELGAVLDTALPSIPHGAGKAAQLVRPTQLCWFSQPQPLLLVTQTG